MADDSDIDSWYSKKQTDFPGTLSSCNSKFDDNSTFSYKPNNYGKLGFSNGYSSLNNFNETKPKSSRSGPEVRFINPAIYAESLNPLNDPQETTPNSQTDEEANVIVEVRCGDSNDLSQGFTALSVNEESPRSGGGDHSDQTAADTYRCNSLQSNISRTSTLTLTNNSKSITRLIRRCEIAESPKIFTNSGEDEDVQRFSLNGRNRVVQFSSTSLSSSSAFSDSRTSGLALARKIAHKEWVQKKQRAAQVKTDAERRAELRHQEEDDRVEKERLERETRERENFLQWQEMKKNEEANRKLAVDQELDLQRRLKAFEDQAAVAKIIHLQQWARRKEDAHKAQQKEQELKRKAIAEERKNRLEKSSQAFEKWRESAKSRPRPATQGLLPHQRAKPSFVNPKPWQKIVDDNSVELKTVEKKDSSTKNVNSSEPKNNVRKIIASHQ